MPLVYCSGIISGRTYEGATSWYKTARRWLNQDIQLLLPMRGKLSDHFEGQTLKAEGYPENSKDWLGLVATDDAITGRDHDDVHRCDLVLMNLLGAEKVSIGCMIEAGWAHAYRKPIVLVCEPGNPHWGHPILRGVSTYRPTNLVDACTIVCYFFERS